MSDNEHYRWSVHISKGPITLRFYGVVMSLSHFYIYKDISTSGLPKCFIMLQRIWNPAVLPFLFARLHFRKSGKKLFSSPLHLPRDTAECWRSHLLRSNLSFVSSYPHPPPPPIQAIGATRWRFGEVKGGEFLRDLIDGISGRGALSFRSKKLFAKKTFPSM